MIERQTNSNQITFFFSLRVIDEHGIEFNHIGKEKAHSQTYYQVLMDFRDSPFIRTQTESVTFLSTGKNSKQLCSIPFMDYVSHTDVIPYANTDSKPIENELFHRFLTPDAEDKAKFKASDTLLNWQQKNHGWLKLSDVYKETTNNIQVTAIPFFIGIRYSQNTTNYWWRYCIRIENLGEESIRIRERHWTIYSMSGCLESLSGTGIAGQVGTPIQLTRWMTIELQLELNLLLIAFSPLSHPKEPVLSKNQPAFQYSSHVNIQQAPSGHMSGHFKVEKENGELINVVIQIGRAHV